MTDSTVPSHLERSTCYACRGRSAAPASHLHDLRSLRNEDRPPPGTPYSAADDSSAVFRDPGGTDSELDHNLSRQEPERPGECPPSAPIPRAAASKSALAQRDKPLSR